VGVLWAAHREGWANRGKLTRCAWWWRAV
jgi:hypothetical protein